MMGKKTGRTEPIGREELCDMLVKYKIGKKPLSKLLGWGDTTVLLYTGQDELPDNEYTCRLKQLYDRPEEYLKVLEAGRTRITEVAYTRSINAVKALFPSKKIFSAVQIAEGNDAMQGIGSVQGMVLSNADFLKLSTSGTFRVSERDSSDRETSLLRTQTILFWSQVISLCLFNAEIFEDDYTATGKGYHYKAVEERAMSGADLIEGAGCELELDPEPTGIISFVRDVFEWYGTAAIQKLMQTEWHRLSGPVSATRRRRIVSKEMLRRCYSEIFAQAKVHKLKDFRIYIQKRMNFLFKAE